MSRATFLTLYIITALLFSGGLASSWTITIMALTLGQKGFDALLSPVFVVSILSPLALIVLAHLRGKQIGVLKLVWFPIAALILTLLPLVFGLIAKLLSGHGHERFIESMSLYTTMFVATASTLGPLILHTICCVVGGKRNPVSVISTEAKSEKSNTTKIVVVLVSLLLIGGYFYFARVNHGEEVHWVEEAVLQDGRTLRVHRTTTLAYSKGGELSDSAHKWPNYYSFSVSHPDSGELIEWKGDYGFNPISLDFVDGVPYLVILQFNVFADLKQYGCPEIPYVFFRYDMGKKHWNQISSSTYPAVLNHANLTAAYDGGYISEGTVFTQKDVALRNADAEGAETVGYFSNTIPKDFDSWDYERKYEEKNSHYQDGCRPEQPVPIPNTARRVNLNISDKINYDPEWVYKNADEAGSQWQQLAFDKDRSDMCKALLLPEVPGIQGSSYFIGDPSHQKKLLITGPLICDTNSVWAFDYTAEKRRVVIAKYSANGDLAFRIGFVKPEVPEGYTGSVMYPTVNFDDGFLSFEWWNFRHSGQDVHVKQSMMIKVPARLLGTTTSPTPVTLQGNALPTESPVSAQTKSRKPPYLALGSPVHMISIYQATKDSADQHNFQETKQGVVNLAVSEPDAVLLLFAFEPVEWRISVAKGIAIKRVIAIGAHDQRITFASGEKPQEVVARNWDILQRVGINLRDGLPTQHEPNDLVDIADISLALTGALPRSYQGNYEASTTGYAITPLTSLFALPMRRTSDTVGYITTLHSNFREAVNGNILLRGTSGYYTDAWSDRIYSAGKFYFEGKMRVTGAMVAHGNANIGLCLARGKTIESATRGGITVIHPGEQKLYKDGDIFGVAADFEQQRIYFHVNGEWLNGAPGSGNGTPLEKGKEYRACLFAAGTSSNELLRGGVRSDTTWEVNFGDRSFSKTIPSGYVSFNK